MTDTKETGTTQDVETIERHIASTSFRPTANAARAVRDAAAEHLLVDPTISNRLASLLLEALERADDAPPEALAIAWRCRAEALLYSGQPLDARRAYDRAIRNAERASAQSELGQILVGLVIALNALGEMEEAARCASRAELVLERTGDRGYLGKLHLAQGNAHYEAERFGDAHRAYRRAYTILQAEGTEGPAWAILLMNLGVACSNLGRLTDAERYFLESETHAAAHDLELLCAHARFNRAYLERLKGDYRHALALFESSRDAFIRHEAGSLPASVDRAMAEIYLDLAMPKDALALARRARETYDAHGMWLDARIAETDEAVVLLETGRPDEAIGHLDALDAAFAKRRMAARRAVVVYHAARAQLALGRPGEARHAAVRARDTFSSRGMNEWASRARRLVAETYIAEDLVDRAAHTLASAARAGGRLPVRERLALAAVSGRLSLARGRRAEARSRLLRARELMEQQRTLIPGIELRARALAEHADIYEGLVELEVASRRPRLEALLDLVEAGRARAFTERTALGAAPRDEALSELRTRLGQLAQRLETAQLSVESDDDPDALRREIRSLETAVLEREHRRQTLERETPLSLDGASLEAVTASLRSGESLVMYYVTGPRVIALVLSKRGRGDVRLRHVVLDADRATVERLVDRGRFQLESMSLGARRPSTNLTFRRRTAETLLAELYRVLLGPLQDDLVTQGRLIVIPHGMLHQVPFEALHDGERYIADHWVLVRAASAAQLVRASRARRRGSGPVVLAGVTKGLTNVKAEIEAVAAALRDAAPEVLVDPTTDTLLEGLERARLLHISTHGTFREDNPLFSRLTTGDGALFLADVIERPSTAELVVLSACHGGKSFTGRGDDLAGLAYGFLATGARCLVASQWRVHDEATASLMSAFYGYFTGDERADAARALSLAARDVRAEWDHPFYWGSFSVYGR